MHQRKAEMYKHSDAFIAVPALSSKNDLYHAGYSVKKALPEEYRQKTQASLLTAVVSVACATLTCYPLDIVRRQMQMRGTPYKSVLEAIPEVFFPMH
ncbi:Mitochondrial substrate/solute carrier [Corchorus olitorius]|uniref:Mitochondrial substrate/solute carrier n=1 Tax=Corchorus olitorius TaxID=93759 RepID=A0A1R3ISZ6_9ROSI|nr:Mitochondrial substrate/solute carrier [Corchorus olitorius]